MRTAEVRIRVTSTPVMLLNTKQSPPWVTRSTPCLPSLSVKLQITPLPGEIGNRSTTRSDREAVISLSRDGRPSTALLYFALVRRAVPIAFGFKGGVIHNLPVHRLSEALKFSCLLRIDPLVRHLCVSPT